MPHALDLQQRTALGRSKALSSKREQPTGTRPVLRTLGLPFMGRTMSQAKSSTIRTARFESCRAVFQGGGCRGAAHAGAYQAAVECGVTFSAIAGTSAGSIVAALIGAGAQPDYLLRTLIALDFTQLLGKPQPQDGFPSFAARLLARGIGWLPGQVADAASRIVRFGGIHSAEGLERWVND